MNVIFLMLDSLNRTYTTPYGAKIKTPNFERLAKRCVTMDNHWTGSLPTMPCRHEIYSGRHDYLWRGWGALEPYDLTPMQMMNEKGKGQMSMLLTDCYHLFADGASNYHCDFNGWEFLRGHEADNWKTGPVDETPARYKETIKEKAEKGEIYMRNTINFRDEKDFFGPKLMSQAAEWLDNNHTHKDFFFMVDSFDPHEPHHVPAPYDQMYSKFNEPFPIWNTFKSTKDCSPAMLKHLRAQYQGKVTMLDKYIGLVLDRMDRYNLWDNSLVIVTSDHGHHLGEMGMVAKNLPPYYRHLTHIPLWVSMPKMKMKAGGRSKILTSQIDMYPTICDALGLKIPKGYKYHGYSMIPALKGKTRKIREIAHTGYYGAGAVVTDGKHALHVNPVSSDNQPLYTYGINLEPFHRRTPEPYMDVEAGQFLPFTDCTIFKKHLATPPALGKSKSGFGGQVIPNMLFELDKGEKARDNVIKKKPAIAKRLKNKLIADYKRIDCPEEQFERLGLK